MFVNVSFIFLFIELHVCEFNFNKLKKKFKNIKIKFSNIYNMNKKGFLLKHLKIENCLTLFKTNLKIFYFF